MNLKVNGKKLEVEEGKTILEVCNSLGIEIPTLCYFESFNPESRCRVCMVEANDKLVPSCSTKVQEGMIINTETEKVKRARRLNLELVMNHTHDATCKSHELAKLCADLNEFRFRSKEKAIDNEDCAIVFDHNKCILCGRCITACRDFQTVSVLQFANRSNKSIVTPYFEESLANVECIKCGQCINQCPSNALTEKSYIKEVFAAIKDPKKIVIAQTAPSIRASLGEEFGLPPGILVTEKMVGALKKLGFDKVFDTDLGADFTISEEAAEFVERLEKDEKLPQFTSCCPAWVKFCEHWFPDLIPHLSTTNSPINCLAPIIKNYYPRISKIDPRDIVNVCIVPCTAKKFEIKREPHKANGLRYIDYSLTTREFAQMMRMKNLNLDNVDAINFDSPFGLSSGGGDIFGASGGVMESALRTAYEYKTGKPLEHLEFEELRGYKGIKEAKVKLNGKTIWVAVASGLGNARKLAQQVLEGKSKYHFIEVMSCPGGCVGGGGQPKPQNSEIIKKRQNALYTEDRCKAIRQAHKNPDLIKVYKEFLGKPLSRLAERYLHTTYQKREVPGK